VPPPSLTVQLLSPEQTFNLGGETNLSCTARSIPEVDSGVVMAVFTWYMADGTVLINGGRSRIVQVDRLSSHITISSLRFTDIRFSCSAIIYLTRDRSSTSADSPLANFLVPSLQCKPLVTMP
jgi:hypothetical protein